MKKLILISIIASLFASCNRGKAKEQYNGFVFKTGDSMDGKILTDENGNIYLLKHNIGDCYFVSSLDTTAINGINSLIKSKKR